MTHPGRYADITPTLRAKEVVLGEGERRRRYERGSVLVTSNLPFDEWTSVFGAERLTGALLDRLTHHVHILEMNGESYRLRVSRRRQGKPEAPTNAS